MYLTSWIVTERLSYIQCIYKTYCLTNLKTNASTFSYLQCSAYCLTVVNYLRYCLSIVFNCMTLCFEINLLGNKIIYTEHFSRVWQEGLHVWQGDDKQGADNGIWLHQQLGCTASELLQAAIDHTRQHSHITAWNTACYMPYSQFCFYHWLCNIVWVLWIHLKQRYITHALSNSMPVCY